jgi:hypothetical protein
MIAVWSLGKFGGVPPKSAMSFCQSSSDDAKQGPGNPAAHPNKVDTSEYKFVFNSCGVGMAITSLGERLLTAISCSVSFRTIASSQFVA